MRPRPFLRPCGVYAAPQPIRRDAEHIATLPGTARPWHLARSQMPAGARCLCALWHNLPNAIIQDFHIVIDGQMQEVMQEIRQQIRFGFRFLHEFPHSVPDRSPRRNMAPF